MSAGVVIKLGANSRIRDLTERFKPTRSYTELWIVDSDLDNFADDLELALPSLWNYTLLERSNGAEVGLHYSVTLENTTAASAPAGAWVQAKQHFDGVLSAGQWDDIDVVRSTIHQTVAVVKKLAKYQ